MQPTEPQPGLFITGTDTGVGKTWVTVQIARALRAAGKHVGIYKPVCTGSRTESGRVVWDDVEQHLRALGETGSSDRICPQRFHAPLSPPVSARLEGLEVRDDLISSGLRWWFGRVDVLLVEGVGGLLCPLTVSSVIADFAAETRFPLIVVARSGLGTINHTLLTVETAQRRGLSVAGIVLNSPDGPTDTAAARTNRAEIAARTEVPILTIADYNCPDGLLQDETGIKINWAAMATRS